MHRAGTVFLGLVPVLAMTGGALADQGDPIVRVLRADGQPGMMRPDGEDVVLATGSVIPAGYVAWTGPDVRMALVFAPFTDTPPEHRDALLLAPNTRVRIDAFPPEGDAPERFLATVEGGVVRAVTRAVDGRTCFALRTGDYTVHLENTDFAMSVAHETGNTGLSVFKGAVVVPIDGRRIKVTEGKLRTVIDGKISGARALRDREKSMPIGLTTIDGLQLTAEPQRRAGARIKTAPARESDLLPLGSDVAYVRMETTQGPIIIELNRDRAPATVQNFLDYVNDGFYDGTIFHRVVNSGIGVVQGGGFGTDLERKETRSPIANEWENGLKNERGTLSMARLGGQANSATSQFFINTRANAALDLPNDGAAYAVFGRVVRGMEVVDAIAAMPTKQVNQILREAPVQTVEITAARVTEREAATDGISIDNTDLDNDKDRETSPGAP